MRAWQVFGDDRFINLSGISVSQHSFVDFTILCCTIYLKPSLPFEKSNNHAHFQSFLSETARLYWGLFFASKNRRERVKLALRSGHVPSVRRAPQARNSPTQQVSRAPFRKEERTQRRGFTAINA
jgi:hypothetical protein